MPGMNHTWILVLWRLRQRSQSKTLSLTPFTAHPPNDTLHPANQQPRLETIANALVQKKIILSIGWSQAKFGPTEAQDGSQNSPCAESLCAIMRIHRGDPSTKFLGTTTQSYLSPQVTHPGSKGEVRACLGQPALLLHAPKYLPGSSDVM